MEHSQLASATRVPQAWIESLRLRTLPLAAASILTGSTLAWRQGQFDLTTALLALLTTALLQILSNLANDYGDALKGSDTPQRIGPLRGMQKGAISKEQMRIALWFTVILTVTSGGMLILRACHTVGDIIGFIAMGALAIVAAIAYTVGKKPYGYLGLGDLSVMVFFGWLGVLGSSYLQTQRLDVAMLLPASACGLLATAVLNINNLRDIDSDRVSGKFTLAVRLGSIKARRYHVCLLCVAVACLALYTLLQHSSPAGWLFMLGTPLLWRQADYILRETSAVAMRPMLEKTVKSALLINVLFAVGLILS